MPRWLKTPADYDAAIAKSQEKIAKYQQLLESEETALLKLETEKRDVEMKEIYDFMNANDMSPADVIATLSASKPQQTVFNC